ncbi:unnamed protein product [Owenia fusiformis]|uniref:Uncharacterized protein n=1 Tax=Owenia fusiformis TaxID=6347 RepID=A0A8J1UNY0_OWEFU|nr:unnamed protein product [Owenia fusiformis]
MVKQSRENSKEQVSVFQREDVQYWLFGIIFILGFNASIYVAGHLRHWDATSGFTHNTSATSKDRFLPEPFIEEPGVKGRHGANADGRWYYWKLPPDQATVVTRLSVWLCYAGHQILIWWVIYQAQLSKSMDPGMTKYSSNVMNFNKKAVTINVLFHILHLLQTHVTYDATAQDVSVASSQSSVIMMAIFVFVIEYKERGLFFGWPTLRDTGTLSKTLRLDYKPIDLIRKYHAYPFAWASTYTFWYHPMENTLGHVTGIFYTWIILLQGSLMYTHMHTNKYWRLFLEAWVAVHGYQVAIQTGGPALLGTTMWPMFAFGFLIMITVTQIFTIGALRRLPLLLRLVPFLSVLTLIIYSYSWIPNEKGQVWVRMPEVTRIAATYYMFVPLTWLILRTLMKLQPYGSHSQRKLADNPKSTLKHYVNLCFAFLIYLMMIWLSVHVQKEDWTFHVIAIMVVLVFVFSTAVCITTVMFVQPAMETWLPRQPVDHRDNSSTPKRD